MACRLLPGLRRTFLAPSGVSSCLTSRILCTQSAPSAAVSNDPAENYVKKCEKLSSLYTKYVDEILNRWKKANEIYFGKERDYENFPSREVPLRPPPVRMYFIPDSFFQSFYQKTGVTGPYLLMFGTAAFMVSKEVFVIAGESIEMMVKMLVVYPTVIHFVSQRFIKFYHRITNERIQNMFVDPMNAIVKRVDANICAAQEELARASAIPMLVKLKEENLALQLEALYRQRLKTVHQTVTRQLNYHVERTNIEKTMQHRHLVQWIVDQVVKGITPTQEKEALTHCISELRRLAQVHKATV